VEQSSADDPGDSGRVAEGPGHLVVSGADFRLGGYHRADARGGTQVQHCRWTLARHYGHYG